MNSRSVSKSSRSDSGAGEGGVPDVAADEHRVHLLGARDLDQLAEDGLELGDAALAAHGAAQVPVGGVEESHQPAPSQRSKRAKASTLSATSEARVAHAGRGNSTSSGTGISGC